MKTGGKDSRKSVILTDSAGGHLARPIAGQAGSLPAESGKMPDFRPADDA